MSFCGEVSLPKQPIRRHVPGGDHGAGQDGLAPVDMRRMVRRTLKGQQFDRAAGGVNNPVFAHPGGGVGVTLLAPVLAGGAG